jgi:hypothetical protein
VVSVGVAIQIDHLIECRLLTEPPLFWLVFYVHLLMLWVRRLRMMRVEVLIVVESGTRGEVVA